MLTINNLHANKDGKEILKGINLEIGAGEIHAIMGPNGSGKSTLASLITGMEGYDITQGEILFEGKNLLDISAQDRAHAGIFLAFQHPVEIPGINNETFLRTIVNEQRKMQGLEPLDIMAFKKVLKEKAGLVGLRESFLKRSLNEGFSGGEKKRNEMLQMSLLEPKLKVLDEIDSGLDIDALQAVAQSIKRLHSKDSSTLVITHYQRILEHLDVDFVHVLADGKIIKSGGKELAQELEEKGYDWLLPKAPLRVMNK